MKIKKLSLILLILLLMFFGFSSAKAQSEGSSSKGSKLDFSIRLSTNKISFGEEIRITISFKNNTKKSVFIGNWSRTPAYYFQKDGEISVSYLPFSFKLSKDGKGWTTGSPAAFYPNFLELKPNRTYKLSLKIPPNNQPSWKLKSGIWNISVQHIWVDNISDFKNLYGQKLAEEIKAKGQIVTQSIKLLVN